MKKLTIGMPCYDDYDGVFFSVQALRLYHREAMGGVELVVVDGNPNSLHGVETQRFCSSAKVRYIPAASSNGPAQTKQQVFDNAKTEFVMCMDAHILLEQGSVAKLIEFMETDGGNILHGPLVYDDLHHVSTHFDIEWRGGMEGIWGTDERGRDANAEPFEIKAQGMGLFACRRDAWLGFNTAFRGFGGEEVYIHRKFRAAGKKAMCLPFLRWAHRFGRPNGIPYPIKWEDRIHNYLVGYRELGIDESPVVAHFESLLGSAAVSHVIAALARTQNQSLQK